MFNHACIMWSLSWFEISRENNVGAAKKSDKWLKIQCRRRRTAAPILADKKTKRLVIFQGFFPSTGKMWRKIHGATSIFVHLIYIILHYVRTLHLRMCTRTYTPVGATLCNFGIPLSDFFCVSRKNLGKTRKFKLITFCPLVVGNSLQASSGFPWQSGAR